MSEEGSVTMTLNEYHTTVLAGGRWYHYISDAREWLPFEPVNVDEPVYKELGERTFDRHDNTQSLEEFIAELQALAAKAPKTATRVVIEFGTDGCEDSYDATYEVGYYREPTTKERADREETNRKIAERDARNAAEAEERERATYERLRAKFASDSDGDVILPIPKQLRDVL